jgi:hypothetical protein
MKKTVPSHTSKAKKLQGNFTGVGVRNPVGKNVDPYAPTKKNASKKKNFPVA